MGKDLKGKELGKGFSQRKDGAYCYRYKVDNKSSSIYDRNLNILKVKAERIKKDLSDGIDATKANSITLNVYFELYLSLKKTEVRETTYTNYKYLYDTFVRDSIGKKKIAEIKNSDIRKFYNSLLNDDIKIGTVTLIHNILSPIFRMAVNDDIIRRNPTDEVLKSIKKNSKQAQEKRFAMTQKEQTEFMNYARNSLIYSEYVPLFTVFLGTGLRVGECFALTWEDIDFKNRNIHVNKTLTYKVGSSGKAEFHISPTKTGAGTRTIPMLEDVRKALLQTREKSIAMGKCETVVDGYSDFVFANSRNHVHKPNTINRVIDNIIKYYNKEENEKAKKKSVNHSKLGIFRCIVFATHF